MEWTLRNLLLWWGCHVFVHITARSSELESCGLRNHDRQMLLDSEDLTVDAKLTLVMGGIAIFELLLAVHEVFDRQLKRPQAASMRPCRLQHCSPWDLQFQACFEMGEQSLIGLTFANIRICFIDVWICRKTMMQEWSERCGWNMLYCSLWKWLCGLIVIEKGKSSK